MSIELAEGKSFNKTVGLRIRCKRDNLGWTREKLAEEAKVSRTTIYHVENGRRGSTAETLARICLALNTTSDYILFGLEDKKLLNNQAEQVKTKLIEALDILRD